MNRHTFSNHFKPAEKSKRRYGVKSRRRDFENGVVHAKFQRLDNGAEKTRSKVLEFVWKVLQNFGDEIDIVFAERRVLFDLMRAC